MRNKYKISVIGLGYVGLPLAISLSKHFKIVGYDENNSRIDELRKGIDTTKEIKNTIIKKTSITFTDNEINLKDSDIYIITVPTPVDKNNKPDLRKILSATKTVTKYISKNNLIIYESTIYPGCTSEILIPLIEQKTNFILNKFFVGYSPEE